MKIAFVGDSYCADTHKGTWLALVLKEYNAEMICKGRGGTALFHAYEDLLGIVDEADYIIFCITDAYRVPNRYGIPIDTNWLSKISWDFKKLLENNNTGPDYHNNREQLGSHHEPALKAGELYYKNLISFEFHRVAQKGILMQMDELMLQKKKKCIWFPCFDESMQEFIPKSGPITNVSLIHLSDTELLHLNLTPESRYKLRGNDILRLNHFNEENNKNLARIVIDVIQSNNFIPREIKMEEYFKVLK